VAAPFGCDRDLAVVGHPLRLARRFVKFLTETVGCDQMTMREESLVVTRPEAVAWVDHLKGYVALTKPRIIELLLVTTVPTMVVARRGWPSGLLVLFTLIGGALSAGGANATNMYIDRDIDAVMNRTKGRPLVTGTVSPTGALLFAILLEVGAFVVLWTKVNLISALLALGAALFYVFVYTIGLKRHSRQNIVIGGAAGAVPVLVGWAAVTGHLGWAPLLLFALVFVWTPSHFWSLAIRYKDDYGAAGVPMLPSVASPREVARQIIGYSGLLVAVSLVFGIVGHLGVLYFTVALLSGGLYLYYALQLRGGAATQRQAMRLFHYSISYLTLLFFAMAADTLLRAYILH